MQVSRSSACKYVESSMVQINVFVTLLYCAFTFRLAGQGDVLVREHISKTLVREHISKRLHESYMYAEEDACSTCHMRSQLLSKRTH